MSGNAEKEFIYGGVNHLALVCRDMVETVRFYRDVLGMPLVKTIDLPDGGQHFFFDIGNNNLLAFFWFPDNADLPAPGTSAPAELPGIGDFTSDVSSMNHDRSKWQMSRTNHDGVWLRSLYFFDPNGVLLEFASLSRAFTAGDVEHDPRNAEGERVAGVINVPVRG